jgi:hypothetical protein
MEIMVKKQIFLFIFCGLFLGTASAKTPRKLLLSVGISHFEDLRWNPLRFAFKDASSIHHKLSEEGTSWNKLLMASPSGKESVGYKDLLKALDLLKQQNTSPQDIVIIYISTHGTIFQNQKTGALGRYIVTSDTQFHNVDQTALPYKKLMALFRHLKSKKKVLILDSCYSGTGKSQLSPKVKMALKKLKSGTLQEDQVFQEGEILLFSSQKSEPSLEDPRLQHSVYTSFLLEGLRQDLNNDGAVTITEAHLYARGLTRKFTKGRQNPTARMIIEGVDPIVISGKRKNVDQAFLYNRWSAKSHLLIYVDGVLHGKLGGGIPVKSGKHRITITDPETHEKKVDRVFRFEKGREYLIEGLFSVRSHPHTIDVELKTHSFLSSTVQNELAPTTLLGVGLRYTHQEFWKTFDLGVSLTLLSVDEEIIPLSLGSLLKQKRSQLGGQVFLGQRESLSFLSTADGRVEGHVSWSFGLSFLSIGLEKNYYSNASSKTPFQTDDPLRKTVPGMTFSGGLGFEVPSVNLRSGIRLEAGLLSNPFDKGGSLLLEFTPSFYVGRHW